MRYCYSLYLFLLVDIILNVRWQRESASITSQMLLGEPDIEKWSQKPN
jgi:aryl carrier-like protein